MTEYVSHTGSSIQVRVLAGSGQDGVTGSGETGSGRAKRVAVFNKNDYGAGLYHATGAGDLAFYRVMRECSTRGWNVVARFDCSSEADRTTTTPSFIDGSTFTWSVTDNVPTDPAVTDDVPTDPAITDDVPTPPNDPDVGDPNDPDVGGPDDPANEPPPA